MLVLVRSGEVVITVIMFGGTALFQDLTTSDMEQHKQSASVNGNNIDTDYVHTQYEYEVNDMFEELG